MKLCYPDGKLLLRKLCMNWDQDLWNSFKFSFKKPNKMFWNKAILMSSELTLSFPCRTAHLKRRNKINPNLFSFIIHDFTPGYTYVSTNINSSLVISGLNYWFATIRGPSLPVFTSCRSYSDPHILMMPSYSFGLMVCRSNLSRQWKKSVFLHCFSSSLAKKIISEDAHVSTKRHRITWRGKKKDRVVPFHLQGDII